MSGTGKSWTYLLVAVILSSTLGDVPIIQTSPSDYHGLDEAVASVRVAHQTSRLREADDARWHFVQLSDLSDILYQSCALLALPPYVARARTLLAELSRVFRNDAQVLLGQLANIENSSQVLWRPGTTFRSRDLLAFYPKETVDRTCLLVPKKQKFLAELYVGPLELETLVQFINEKCGTFRTASGSLNPAGLFHRHIQQNLFRLAKPVGRCRRIRMPERSEFFQEYLLRSRPVIIENAIAGWPAMQKWTMEYFHEEIGSKEVHLKLTPDGVFEGVEAASLWSGYHDDWIPEAVKSQLEFPDLVVVRPATTEMKFSSFLDLISSGNRTYSAYLEYSSIFQYMPQLVADVAELPMVQGRLELRHLNMWLSDGNTIGKLHFDPYDNLLCQVSGEKHLTLFDPHHNENLYEAHIPEAILSFDSTKGRFQRHSLLESTSMVMSPVDIQDPNLEQFPRFEEAGRLECTLRPGDALFMPAFWWHEVQSRPDPVQQRNLAVNFWYEPVFTKEFPCAECRLEFNMFYRRMLEDLWY